MTSQELIDICLAYENSWTPTRTGNWYIPNGSAIDNANADWKYSVHFHINWSRERLETKAALNRQLKETVG